MISLGRAMYMRGGGADDSDVAGEARDVVEGEV